MEIGWLGPNILLGRGGRLPQGGFGGKFEILMTVINSHIIKYVPFVSNFIEIGQLFRNIPPPGDNSALFWGVEGEPSQGPDCRILVKTHQHFQICFKNPPAFLNQNPPTGQIFLLLLPRNWIKLTVSLLGLINLMVLRCKELLDKISYP